MTTPISVDTVAQLDSLGEPQIVHAAGATLGEGPCWLAGRDTLAWIDIDEGVIHEFDPNTGSDCALQLGQPVGALVPTDDHHQVVVTMGYDLIVLDLITGNLTPLCTVADLPAPWRLNDAACDPHGQLWSGSLHPDDLSGRCALYRIGTGLDVTEEISGVGLSNGIDWSPDGKVMYWIDSAAHAIDAFDVDAESGEIAHRRRFATLSDRLGLPDGLTVDRDGNVWVCVWEGSCVIRFDPAGQPTGVVGLPTPLVTSCTFGGDDFDTLFVTTASVGIDDDTGRSCAGALFSVADVGFGRPPTPFRMERPSTLHRRCP